MYLRKSPPDFGKVKTWLRVPIPGDLTLRKSQRMTLVLIIINVVVYLVSSFENGFIEIGDYWVSAGAFVPMFIASPSQWYRILSSMFLHADLFHLLFNMYFLFIFGRAVETSLGRGRFLLLYFSSGIVASLFHTAFGFVEDPISYAVPAIGASGAISGILGAYLMLYPGTSMLLVLPIFLLPWFFWIRASYYILFWFATQVIYGFAKAAGGTAVFAHAGGFVAGIALLSVLASKERVSQLRLLSSMSFPNYLRFTAHARRGLGRFTKAVVSVLLLSLLAGSAYSSLLSADQGSIKSIDLQYTCNGVPYSDYVVFQSRDIDPQISNIPVTTTRILMNRLSAASLLYNSSYANGKELKISNWTSELPVKVVLGSSASTVNVPTTIHSFKGIYDPDGFLAQAQGSLTTSAINIALQGGVYKITLVESLNYDFSISCETIALKLITEYTGALSTSLTAWAIIVVAFRDRSLAVVGED
ncbi:MAG: rhomboid family intramembrane serine protease [Candidatus Methanomethylicaceae archaeon]